MAETKKNKGQYFEEIKTIVAEHPDTQEYVDFLENEIEKYHDRAAKNKAARQAKKAEGDALKEAIYEVLAEGGDYRVNDLVEAIAEDFPEATTNKVIYRVNALIKEGRAAKEPVKGEKGNVMTYKLA